MKPIFMTVAAKLPLVVIPDSQAHVDGHPVLTYTYSIFRDKYDGHLRHELDAEKLLSTAMNDDPDYLGYITFEQPGKLFTYTRKDGQQGLSGDEIEEVIEQISQYRDSPQMWNI
jgi:hypothetical protein